MSSALREACGLHANAILHGTGSSWGGPEADLQLASLPHWVLGEKGGLVNIHASPTALTRAPRQCCQDSLPEEVKGVFILILLASSEILLVIKLWTFVDFQNRGRNELGKFHMLAVAGLLMGVMERHSI